MAAIVPPRQRGVNQQPELPENEEVSEEQKVFRETYQLTAGMPARERAAAAKDAATGSDLASDAAIREQQRSEAGMGPSSYVQPDPQDVDPGKAAKAPPSAEEVTRQKEALITTDSGNIYDALEEGTVEAT